MSMPKILQQSKRLGRNWAVVAAPKKHPYPNCGATLYQYIEGSWIPMMMGHPIVLQEIADNQNQDIPILERARSAALPLINPMEV